MTITSLIETPSELTSSAATSKCAVVLMTRIRLARNLAGRSFPGWADADQRAEILSTCREAVASSHESVRSGIADGVWFLLGALLLAFSLGALAMRQAIRANRG